MKKIAITYAILHTLFLPESSIIIWREIGLPLYLISLITFTLGNVLVTIIFWRQSIIKWIPLKALQQLKKIIKLNNWITRKKTVIKDFLKRLNLTQKMSLGILLFIASSIIISLLPFKITLGLLLFAILYLLFSYFLKGKEANLSTGDYLSIIILNFIPIVPGPGQTAVFIVAQKNTLKAKLVYFVSKGVRTTIETIFYDQLLKLFASF